MSATYYGILTRLGEAKQANALALGTTLKITQLSVGDGGGDGPDTPTPTPDPEQKKLIREWRRAPLNRLYVDPANENYLVAEQVLPENEGGHWIREWGLWDEDGDLVAVSNCPPTYKPLLAEGSGRTQVIRMVIMVASTAAFTLKIDPAVVLATRQYVDAGLLQKVDKADLQQSENDATPGRILRVGQAFGLGADNLLGTSNLNNITTPGFYGNSASNAATPERNYPVTRAGVLLVGTAGSAITNQLYLAYGTGEIYTRARYRDSWSAWDYVPTLSRLPVASEAVAGIGRLATAVQAQELTDTSALLTPKRLDDAFAIGRIIATGGINQQIPGGMIIKTGFFYGATGTVTFPTPFPTAALTVVGSEVAAPAGTVDFVMFQLRGLDRFKFNPELRNKAGTVPGAATIRYLAVGF